MPKYIYLFVIAAFVFSACSTTKFLEPGQKLYTGGEVKIADKDVKKVMQKPLKLNWRHY